MVQAHFSAFSGHFSWRILYLPPHLQEWFPISCSHFSCAAACGGYTLNQSGDLVEFYSFSFLNVFCFGVVQFSHCRLTWSCTSPANPAVLYVIYVMTDLCYAIIQSPSLEKQSIGSPSNLPSALYHVLSPCEIDWANNNHKHTFISFSFLFFLFLFFF